MSVITPVPAPKNWEAQTALGEANTPIDEILQRYRSRERDAVRHFLQTATDIIPFFWDAIPHLEEIFGADIPLELEVVINPEASDPAELWGNIVTPCENDDEFHQARKKVTLFTTGSWYRAHYPRIGGRAGFGLTFALDEEAV